MGQSAILNTPHYTSLTFNNKQIPFAKIKLLSSLYYWHKTASQLKIPFTVKLHFNRVSGIMIRESFLKLQFINYPNKSSNQHTSNNTIFIQESLIPELKFPSLYHLFSSSIKILITKIISISEIHFNITADYSLMLVIFYILSRTLNTHHCYFTSNIFYYSVTTVSDWHLRLQFTLTLTSGRWYDFYNQSPTQDA